MTSTFTVGNNPEAVAVNPVTRTVYVANFGGVSMSVINGRTNTVTTTVQDIEFPQQIAVDTANNTVYVPDDIGRLLVINGATNTRTATIQVGRELEGAAVNPLAGTVYVTDTFDNTISLINTRTNKVTSTFTVGNNLPFAIAANPLISTAYVTNRANNTVSLISN